MDNLPREKLALRLWPIQPTAGKFMTAFRFYPLFRQAIALRPAGN